MTDQPDRREAILRAALKVFSQHGFHKASIKQIAHAAGLKSTSHIYWYFENKKAVLQAIIEELTPLRELPLFDPAVRDAMFDMPPETLLTMFAHGMLSIQDDPQLVAVMRLYMSEAARTPEVADAIGGFQLNVLGFLVRYLEHQIAIGRLRPHDVQAIARMWMGAVMINLLGHQIFPVAGEGFPPRDAYVQSIVSVMLDGLRADP